MNTSGSGGLSSAIAQLWGASGSISTPTAPGVPLEETPVEQPSAPTTSEETSSEISAIVGGWFSNTLAQLWGASGISTPTVPDAPLEETLFPSAPETTEPNVPDSWMPDPIPVGTEPVPEDKDRLEISTSNWHYGESEIFPTWDEAGNPIVVNAMPLYDENGEPILNGDGKHMWETENSGHYAIVNDNGVLVHFSSKGYLPATEDRNYLSTGDAWQPESPLPEWSSDNPWDLDNMLEEELSNPAFNVDFGDTDFGNIDLGPVDFGNIDPGPIDSGYIDLGPIDLGPIDFGNIDFGPIDFGYIDFGPVDFGYIDLGPAGFGYDFGYFDFGYSGFGYSGFGGWW
jgi:hypothetical protein